MLQGDEGIADIGFAPVDELAVPSAHQKVGEVQIPMHDGVGKCKVFDGAACVFEDRADGSSGASGT